MKKTVIDESRQRDERREEKRDERIYEKIRKYHTSCDKNERALKRVSGVGRVGLISVRKC